MRRVIVLVCAAALAAAAYGEVGSLISSFYIGYSTYRVWQFGIYRDASYVYSLFDQYQDLILYRFAPSGTYIRYNTTGTGGFSEYGGSDRCHLGPSYFSYIADVELHFVDAAHPFPEAGSFYIKSPGSRWPTNLAWDGQYYYINGDGDCGVFNRYTPAGALVGTWAAAGWPSGLSAGGVSFTKTFNNASGSYLLALTGGSLYAFNMAGGGSLVGSWPIPSPTHWYRGAVCGDAYPASYGTALWVHYCFGTGDRPTSWAYQIDINAPGSTNVVPASVGRIKAVYR